MGVRHAGPFAARTPGGEKAWREALPESPGPARPPPMECSFASSRVVLRAWKW